MELASMHNKNHQPTYVPMQGISLHSVVSTALPMQSLPPQDGIGLLQLLVLVLFPPPQLAEHSPTDQFDQPPSTMQNKHVLIDSWPSYYMHITWTTMTIANSSSNIFTNTDTAITTWTWLCTSTLLG